MSDVGQYDADLTECEHCGWATADLRPTPTRDERLNVFLCEVCYATHGSATTIYRRGATVDDLVTTVAWCTNRVLAEIRAQAVAAVVARLESLGKVAEPGDVFDQAVDGPTVARLVKRALG